MFFYFSFFRFFWDLYIYIYVPNSFSVKPKPWSFYLIAFFTQSIYNQNISCWTKQNIHKKTTVCLYSECSNHEWLASSQDQLTNQAFLVKPFETTRCRNRQTAFDYDNQQSVRKCSLPPKHSCKNPRQVNVEYLTEQCEKCKPNSFWGRRVGNPETQLQQQPPLYMCVCVSESHRSHKCHNKF